MHKPMLAVVIAVASNAAGCVIETRDHGDVEDVASISARWSLRNMADGAVTPCPAGFDTVALYAQAVDDLGEPYGEAAVDLFDCSARGGFSSDLFPDVYQVWIEILSHDRRSRYAQSLSQVLDVRLVDQSFDTEVLNDGGFFLVSWDLVGAVSKRLIECTQAGVDTISLSSSGPDGISYRDTPACTDHIAVTAGLLEGSYAVAIDALGNGRSLGRATSLTDRRVDGPNRVTDLGHIIIPIDGL